MGNAFKLKQSAIGRTIRNHYEARSITSKGLFGEEDGKGINRFREVLLNLLLPSISDTVQRSV